MICYAKEVAKKVLEVDSNSLVSIALKTKNKTVEVSIYDDLYYVLLDNGSKVPTNFSPKERLEFIHIGKVFYQAYYGLQSISVIHQETTKDSFNHNKRMFDKGQKFKFDCDELFMCNAELFIKGIP